MSSGHRNKKISRRVLEELSELVLRGIKDPRVSNPNGGFVTFTDIKLSPDNRYATVYFSVMGGDSKRMKECLEGLNSAKGFFEHHLKKNLEIKFTPNLTFAYDTTIDYSEKINKILNDINAGLKTDEENSWFNWSI